MNISCRIANANTQCGRITNPPEREKVILKSNVKDYLSNFFNKMDNTNFNTNEKDGQ